MESEVLRSMAFNLDPEAWPSCYGMGSQWMSLEAKWSWSQSKGQQIQVCKAHWQQKWENENQQDLDRGTSKL